MMRKTEIGGDFSTADRLHHKEGRLPHTLFYPDFEDFCYTFLGRMALEYILRDILEDQEITRLLLPNFLCDSMIRPALELNLRVEYYPVEVKGGQAVFDVPPCYPGDVFVLISYFGYQAGGDDLAGVRAREEGAVLVEDTSHRMLSASPVSAASDYVFSSLRKWTALPAGGMAVKRKGVFRLPSPDSPPEELAVKRILAMEAKARYLAGESIEKSSVLSDLRSSEAAFDRTSRLLAMDQTTRKWLEIVDWKVIRSRRRENAWTLHSLLEDLEEQDAAACPLLSLSPGDVPLFVPVKVDPSRRADIHRSLIQRKLFMPIHWPKPMELEGDLKKSSSLFEEVISLVVDSRYGDEEMKWIACSLKESLEDKGNEV